MFFKHQFCRAAALIAVAITLSAQGGFTGRPWADGVISNLYAQQPLLQVSTAVVERVDMFYNPAWQAFEPPEGLAMDAAYLHYLGGWIKDLLDTADWVDMEALAVPGSLRVSTNSYNAVSPVPLLTLTGLCDRAGMLLYLDNDGKYQYCWPVASTGSAPTQVATLTCSSNGAERAVDSYTGDFDGGGKTYLGWVESLSGGEDALWDSPAAPGGTLYYWMFGTSSVPAEITATVSGSLSLTGRVMRVDDQGYYAAWTNYSETVSIYSNAVAQCSNIWVRVDDFAFSPHLGATNDVELVAVVSWAPRDLYVVGHLQMSHTQIYRCLDLMAEMVSRLVGTVESSMYLDVVAVDDEPDLWHWGFTNDVYSVSNAYSLAVAASPVVYSGDDLTNDWYWFGAPISSVPRRYMAQVRAGPESESGGSPIKIDTLRTHVKASWTRQLGASGNATVEHYVRWHSGSGGMITNTTNSVGIFAGAPASMVSDNYGYLEQVVSVDGLVTSQYPATNAMWWSAYPVATNHTAMVNPLTELWPTVGDVSAVVATQRYDWVQADYSHLFFAVLTNSLTYY